MADFPIELDDVNAMDPEAFVAAFGSVAEATAWVAAEAEGYRPFATRDAMVTAFAAAIADAEPEQQMALLRAHPELAASRFMTDDSAREQRGAGLDRLSDGERSRLLSLNSAYRQRFGFPFIVAVRGARRDDIVAALEARLRNPPAAEFQRALVEVQRIVRFRIEDRVAP
jgi:2-oxo-4-hydroxy-4-carboxy-5-ureidoimidazoline decarboxylase